jgi:hemolysin activation/secretion protein
MPRAGSTACPWRPLAACAALAALCVASTGRAQTSADLDQLRQRERQEAAERRRREAEPDVRSQRPPLGAGSDELPTETPCFEIREVQVDGADGGFGWARRWARRYQGRCIGAQGVNLIARRLTQRILARGKVTTRAGIPEQTLTAGVLRLVIVAGKIERVAYADDAGPRTRWQTALPMRPGDTLDLSDLDQGLEQLKRVPSQDVEINIRPGDGEGQSVVELRLRRTRPWRVSVSADDAGAKATGKLQGTLTASLDDALTLNDILSVTAQHDADFQPADHHSWAVNGSWSVPWGYWTLGFSGGTSRYQQAVAGSAGAFTYRGRNTTADVKLERVVHRSQASKTGVSLSLGKRWARTYVNDVEIEVQRRDVTAATAGLTHRQTIGRVTLEAEVDVRRGLPWLAHKQPGTEAEYTIGIADASLTVPFSVLGLPLRYRNHSRYQYTRDRILVADQFSIGGRYTVRGFDGEQTLTAERGWYTRNELGATLPVVRQELYVAVDYGRVAGPSSAPLPGIILTGAAIGLRGGWRVLSYDAFAGIPLRKPKGLTTAEPALGFMVTVQY